ncbi:hypothetical protein VA249_45970 (plasmid) [Vibrio alfacsensis]|uniref:hypothetical protein n=1 Tax=Vibrio alfacsensis TaxID=1074311 RepID=UPI001BEE0423|nr:hypothetical protein [Vibrio alfacsensis]BBM67951.1 hypothetical protein VA249_45970 [Vibrio alfacsensis]
MKQTTTSSKNGIFITIKHPLFTCTYHVDMNSDELAKHSIAVSLEFMKALRMECPCCVLQNVVAELYNDNLNQELNVAPILVILALNMSTSGNIPDVDSLTIDVNQLEISLKRDYEDRTQSRCPTDKVLFEALQNE